MKNERRGKYGKRKALAFAVFAVFATLAFLSIGCVSAEQTTKIYPSQDSYMDLRHPDTSYGTYHHMYLGAYVNSGEECRDLVQFDLSSISGEEVTSATLHMYRYYKYYNQPLVANVHRVTQSWDEGSATWNKYDSSNSWTSAGGDFDSTVIASTTLAGIGTGGQYADKPQERWDDTWWQWDVTSLVQDWVDGTHPNNGLMVKTNDFSHTMSGFRTKEYGTEYSPYLEVTLEPSLSPTVSISTDSCEYFIDDSMTITIDIDNPTKDNVTFEWYWGVTQFNVFVPLMAEPIPAGYDDTRDYSFIIPDWGSMPFGNVFYVQLLDASSEVLDADVTWWAYSPGVAAMSFEEEANVEAKIKKTIEKIR